MTELSFIDEEGGYYQMYQHVPEIKSTHSFYLIIFI